MASCRAGGTPGIGGRGARRPPGRAGARPPVLCARLDAMLVHLVDGTYELFRYHFALPSHVLVDGREVAATRGALGTVLSILEEGATHVGVCTDQVIESFRNELWPGYKTSEGMPADLLAQFPLFEEGIEALGVALFAMVDVEADDALASAARVAAASTSTMANRATPRASMPLLEQQGLVPQVLIPAARRSCSPATARCGKDSMTWSVHTPTWVGALLQDRDSTVPSAPRVAATSPPVDQHVRGQGEVVPGPLVGAMERGDWTWRRALPRGPAAVRKTTRRPPRPSAADARGAAAAARRHGACALLATACSPTTSAIGGERRGPDHHPTSAEPGRDTPGTEGFSLGGARGTAPGAPPRRRSAVRPGRVRGGARRARAPEPARRGGRRDRRGRGSRSRPFLPERGRRARGHRRGRRRHLRPRTSLPPIAAVPGTRRRHPDMVPGCAPTSSGPTSTSTGTRPCTKSPGSRHGFRGTRTTLHLVQPQQYLTCWVALTDATIANGCPQVRPSLHRTARSSTTTSSRSAGRKCLDDPVRSWSPRWGRAAWSCSRSSPRTSPGRTPRTACARPPSSRYSTS